MKRSEFCINKLINKLINFLSINEKIGILDCYCLRIFQYIEFLFYNWTFVIFVIYIKCILQNGKCHHGYHFISIIHRNKNPLWRMSDHSKFQKKKKVGSIHNFFISFDSNKSAVLYGWKSYARNKEKLVLFSLTWTRLTRT